MNEFYMVSALLVFLVILGMPIAFSIGITTFVYILMTNPLNLMIFPLKMFSGIDSFILMAIPFFVLAAEIMQRAGISTKLFNFVKLFFGNIRGGLAYVNVIGSTIFGSISGAALADVAGLGKVEIEAMKEDGYDNDFSCALTAGSSMQSPLIPPSNVVIVYAGIMSVSVGALLLAAFVPGLLIGLSQIVYIMVMGKKLNLPKRTTKYSIKEIKKILREGLVAIIMPAIILGGIVFGICTPTEAACAAVIYALVVGLLLYKNLKVVELKEALWTTAKSTANLFLIMALASIFAWIMGAQRVPEQIAASMLHFSSNPYVLLFIVNIVLVIVGMWMETGAAVILFAPILAPIMYKVGIEPIHFAVVMIVNLTIGLITPPVGVVLYAVSAVGNIKFDALVKATMPYIIFGFVVTGLVTYFPEICLFLVRMAHLI